MTRAIGLLFACLAVGCGVLSGQQPPIFGTSGSVAFPSSGTDRHPLPELARPRANSANPQSCKLYNFEGLPNKVQIPTFDGISAAGWVSGISVAYGGTAQFINAPSGITAAVFLYGGTNTINFSSPVGSVQFYYATGFAFTLTGYDTNGNQVATETIQPNWDGNPYGYEVWSLIPALKASGNSISWITIQSAAVLNNFLGIDNLNVCQSMTISSIEMTQAIQEIQTLSDLKSTLAATNEPLVPIVAGKPGVMRIYVNPPTDITGVNIEVNVPGVIDQVKEAVLIPSCDTEKQRALQDGCLSTNFYFTPPAGSWTATIDVTDPSSGAVIEEEVLPFKSRTTNELVLKGVGVCSWEVLGSWTSCTNSSSLLTRMKLLTAIAPTATVTPLATGKQVTKNRASVVAPPGGLQPGDTLDDVWWRTVNLELTKMFIQEDSASDPVSSRRTTFFGLISQGTAPQCCIGLAFNIPAHAASAWVNAPQWGTDLAEYLVAHETGHTEFLYHTNTNNPYYPAGPKGCWLTAGQPNTDWPFTTNYLQSRPVYGNGTLEVGFNVAARKILDPIWTFEVMGYCYPPWIAPQRYKKFLTTLGGGAVNTPSLASQPEARPQKPQTTATQPFWLVSGTIFTSGEVQFDPMFQQTLTGDTSGGTGTYSLVVQDSSGGTLFTQYTTPGEGTDYPDTAPPQPLSFAEMVPVMANASQIVLKDASNVTLGSLALGGIAPTVAITNPTAAFDGKTPIRWTITDPDSSTFESRIYYSADNGTTWDQIGVAEDSATTFTADFSTLPGTNGQGLIKVLVSDGVNTGAATSPHFSLPKKVPTLVQILTPEAGAAQPAADAVRLTGVAHDPDDGELTGSALLWSSNLQGQLGAGSPLTVSLQPGVHTITLTATDSDGNSIQTQEDIVIADQPPVLNVGLTTLKAPPTSASNCLEATVNAGPGTNGAPLSLVQYSVDGGNTYSQVPLDQLPYTFYIPGTGLVSLVFEAVDTAGQSYALSGNYFNLYACGSLTVPNLLGSTASAAGTLLSNAGLVAGTLSLGASSTTPAGSVMSQDPVAGTALAPGSSAGVNLVFSNGPQVGAPNVVGLTQAAAAAAITSAGLTLGTVSRVSSPTVAFGAVIGETPAAGTAMNAGDPLNLAISSGAALAIQSPAALLTATVGTVYAPTTMVATGGTPAYAWSATGLPAGLTLDSVLGTIDGTPTSTTGVSYPVVVTVTDTNSLTAVKNYNLVVNPVLALNAANSLPNGSLGAAYAAPALKATGGSGSYQWFATGQAPGLKIDPATGILSGVPTSNAGSPFTVEVTVVDSNGAVAVGTYPLTVGAAARSLCDLTGDEKVDVLDLQRAINEALGLAAASHDLNNDGQVSVTEVQIIMNVLLGMTCMAL